MENSSNTEPGHIGSYKPFFMLAKMLCPVYYSCMSDNQNKMPDAATEAEPKVVLFHGMSQQEVLLAMRAVKAALENPKGVAFAMSTETNMEWKLSDLIEHVWEEHVQMSR